MPDNSLKLPLVWSLPAAVDQRIRNATQLAGKALPAQVIARRSGLPIVTVKFLNTGLFVLPTVELPLANSKYVREPVQVGDLGVVFPADMNLGAVDGLGLDTQRISTRGNLSNLVFFLTGNAGWAPVDPDVLTFFGPHGILLNTPHVDIAGANGKAVARVGDHTVCPAGAGVITSGSSKVFSN